jgi:hypothetical protein
MCSVWISEQAATSGLYIVYRLFLYNRGRLFLYNRGAECLLCGTR